MITPGQKSTEINIKNSKIPSKMITPKLEHPNDRRKQEWESEYMITVTLEVSASTQQNGRSGL